MSNLSPVTHSLDPEGIAWITLDDSSARANVFNPATLSALRASLSALPAERAGSAPRIKAVVIISAKERIFIAGADLKWLAALPDAQTATQAAREGQAVFDLIAGFKVPVVCAIHGACAGGGYELALACAWRIATDAPETRIGLPEVGTWKARPGFCRPPLAARSHRRSTAPVRFPIGLAPFPSCGFAICPACPRPAILPTGLVRSLPPCILRSR